MAQQIFIQIAAYRDPELLPTLADCLARAADPSRLTFGLCWQRDEGESLGIYTRDPRFRIVEVDYRRARGPCWARNRVQSLYAGEPYTLHLDSHHRFVDGWDEICLEMFTDLQSAGVAKPLLTSYAPIYEPDRDPEARGTAPFRMHFRKFTREGLVEVLPETIDDFESRTEPIPARFFSAHFAFTLGRFCQEVPHDPKLYFFGEEPTLAVRAFTHGYDLFHPHRMVLWHQYERKEMPKHWGDHEQQWAFHDLRSTQRARQLLRVDGIPCDIDFGSYGLGTVRSLRDYEAYSGVHYGLRGISNHALQNQPPPEPSPDIDDDHWADRFQRRQTFHVRLSPEAVSDGARDFDFWYVGAHSESEQELYRHDLAGAELEAFLRSGEQEFSFHSSHFVDSWTVWPHSPTRGWLRKITQKVSV